jgi:hypothetical protein
MINKAQQERDDDDLYHKLRKQPNPYLNVSDRPVIRAGKSRLSLQWILLYARARREGMVCMYMSGIYAQTMLVENLWWEYANNMTRAQDARILHIANNWLRKHGKLKKPPAFKGRLELQTA